MELKKSVLIISPYFPPTNAADMQRVRMTLPFLKRLGWYTEIMTVDPVFSDMATDPLLLSSIPNDVPIHLVKAWNKKYTSKIGLGSIALRALWFFWKKANKLLREKRFDLIYFSTTQFPVCILGAYWTKRFGVPYVIDMQDPWHSDYYINKPRSQRPSKYWFAYRLNQYLEPLALRSAGGLVSVSQLYIDQLKSRYPSLGEIPARVIPFGAFETDLETANRHRHDFDPLLKEGTVRVVYAGRGGTDLHRAVAPLFSAFARGLKNDSVPFGRIHFYFIGTSYAAPGHGKKTIYPLAETYGIADYVTEITDRIGFYHVLATLQLADALFVPGSDDPGYTASKLYPYLLTGKPLLAVFHALSPAMQVLNDYGVQYLYASDSPAAENGAYDFLLRLARGVATKPQYNPEAVERYSAFRMAAEQCNLFDQVLENFRKKNEIH